MLVVFEVVKAEVMAEAMATAFGDMWNLGFGFLVFLCGLVVFYAIVYTIVYKGA